MIEVEQTHWAGKPVSGSDRPSPIVVKFVKYKDRLMILQRAKYLKGSKMYINEDYTDAVHHKRKDLMPKLKAARDRGDIAFLRHDKLMIHPCIWTALIHMTLMSISLADLTESLIHVTTIMKMNFIC